LRILDAARWAPSGDNAQPWRFVLRGPRGFDVYGYDTRAYCVYDLDGWASELAHGALLETIAIAASREQLRARISMPDGREERPLRYCVSLEPDDTLLADPRFAAVIDRTVQRRAMETRRLTSPEQRALEEAARPFRLMWFETLHDRARVAALCTRNARIRMIIEEAYVVHRAVIAWNASTSEDRMPDASLGANPLLLASMHRAMKTFARLERLNRLTGTLAPRVALDFLPGIRCSAWVALIAAHTPGSLDDRIAAGRAVQRTWLTATTLGLQMQPQYTPLLFARYAREGRRFTRNARALARARDIDSDLRSLLGERDAPNVVWLARIGPSRPVHGRSLRLPISRLLVESPPLELPPPQPLA
jgi:nitroreductase